MAPATRPTTPARLRTIVSELDAFLDYAEDRLRLSANTRKAYRIDLHTAAAALDGPLDAISTADIERFLQGRQEAISTTNRRIASLGRFFSWARREGYCAANPVAEVAALRDDVRLPRPIRARSELKALEQAIAATAQPYRMLFTILRETGMRADEALRLNAGDVTLDAGRESLHVREAKNNRERTVVLTPEVTPKTLRGLRAWLRELGAVSPHSPLFRSNRGTRVSYDALHYQWGQLCAAARLTDDVDGQARPRYTIHQLRHTRATELIAQYPEHIVSRILGHRDPRSTRRYAEVNEDQVRAALAERGSRR